ncbi:hypothetical protein GCM10023322_00500 [Rugosimonospora acidiphila]|uniref:Uncharacterized protein n=1 Tax=Rugosimonospora acidiphila TaxID=556531 RepID=A0ABP9RHB0_9ACTN
MRRYAGASAMASCPGADGAGAVSHATASIRARSESGQQVDRRHPSPQLGQGVSHAVVKARAVEANGALTERPTADHDCPWQVLTLAVDLHDRDKAEVTEVSKQVG